MSIKKILSVTIALLLAIAPFATLGSAEASALSEATVVWYFPGMWPQPDQDAVFEAVNAMIKEKLNATIDFRALSFGDYEQKMSTVIASGDEYDICFTSNWMNNYGINVGKGAFMDLTELLPTYAPMTYAQVPEVFWDAAKLDGKIYAVICEQISARISAVGAPDEFLQEAGYSLETDFVKGDLRSLEPYLEKMRELHPEAYFLMALDVAQEFLGMEFPNGYLTPGAVNVATGDTTVFNQYKSEAMLNWVKDMQYFNEKGYQDAERRITLPSDPDGDRKAKIQALGVAGAFKPGGAIFDSQLAGFPMIEVPSNTPILTTGGIVATMQALNRNAKQPERAMMILELLNANTEGTEFNRFYNTLNFGIEGTHWNYVDGFLVKTQDGYDRYTTNTDWMFASNYQAIPYEGQPADVWQQTRDMNADAVVSPLCGFLFDVEPVKAEVGACSAVIQEYYRAISLGAVTDDEYNEFLSKLDAAGSDIVIAEMQKQVDVWLAEK